MLEEAANTLSVDDLERLLIELKKNEPPKEVEGDGQAAWLEPMTDEEYARWVHEEEQGWRSFYRRIIGGDNENR